MIWINEVLLPAPQGLEVQLTDTLGKSQVNALGQIVRDVLGAKRRITLRYQHVKGQDAEKIAQVARYTENVDVIYPDMEGNVQLKCRLASMQHRLYHLSQDESWWTDCVLVLEEV